MDTKSTNITNKRKNPDSEAKDSVKRHKPAESTEPQEARESKESKEPKDPVVCYKCKIRKSAFEAKDFHCLCCKEESDDCTCPLTVINVREATKDDDSDVVEGQCVYCWCWFDEGEDGENLPIACCDCSCGCHIDCGKDCDKCYPIQDDDSDDDDD